MSLKQFIDVFSWVSPCATFEKLNAHFHQLQYHYPNFTLNFFSLCDNAQLDTTQLLKISYVMALIQTKLHIAQSNSHAHFFFSSVDTFSNLVNDGLRGLNTWPVSPCTIVVTSEELLDSSPTLTLHQRNNNKFNALCLVASRSNL